MYDVVREKLTFAISFPDEFLVIIIIIIIVVVVVVVVVVIFGVAVVICTLGCIIVRSGYKQNSLKSKLE